MVLYVPINLWLPFPTKKCIHFIQTFPISDGYIHFLSRLSHTGSLPWDTLDVVLTQFKGLSHVHYGQLKKVNQSFDWGGNWNTYRKPPMYMKQAHTSNKQLHTWCTSRNQSLNSGDEENLKSVALISNQWSVMSLWYQISIFTLF